MFLTDTLPNTDGTTSYTTFTGLAGSSTYHFYAAARDDAGNYSAVKSVTNVLTTDVTAPLFTGAFETALTASTTVHPHWSRASPTTSPPLALIAPL